MTPENGRMPIPEPEQRRLFARSGDRCAFPGCPRRLTADGSPPDRLVVLGEMAHIVAESPGGPRGDSPLTPQERNRAENLILLCNNHHQLVDSQPKTYTVERLLEMKADHERWVERRLAAGTADEADLARPPRVEEVVHGALLPVERMPRFIFGAPCEVDEREIQGRLGPLRNGEMAPYIVRGKVW
jgi:hypothetical protein